MNFIGYCDLIFTIFPINTIREVMRKAVPQRMIRAVKEGTVIIPLGDTSFV
ncbi:hypothetical protein KN1_25280 [Stygiolobus caldivivus]|uniref:Uncharacterized protein n=1 Tax=Stygiolobus caldivivus TaxID=2824673 RepID=A0A8D5U7W2_9CREN|nr:hypothetical protein KN1_25280 [Stygiolobus caldivivus]